MTLIEAHAENLSRIWDALFKRRSPESYGLSRDGLVIIEPIQNTNAQIPPSLGGWQFKVVNPKYELMLKVSHRGGEAYSVALFENSKHFDALRTVFADSSDLRGLPEVVERFISGHARMMRNL